MSETARLLFEQLGISLLLGVLVGLQRQHSESAMAGLRTFPLITILGTLTAVVDSLQGAGGWIVAAGFLGVVAVVVVTNLYQLRCTHADFGMTTEAAILLMYVLGAYLVGGERVVAIALGAGVAVLLQFKPELHGIAAKLGDADVRAIMTFALITCVILPVLPNTTYDLVPPLNVLNPFEIWMMVVLMVGISLGGYLIYRFFGRNAGIVLGGVLGGAISSTATTISYAKRTRTTPSSSRMAALVVMIASAVVFGRVMIEIAVVAPHFFPQLAAPISLMMGTTVLATVIVWLLVRRESDEIPQQKNPTELKSAILFAGLYTGVLMALSAARTYLGSQGLFGIAIVSGLTDMDAITLSTARMVQRGPDHGGITATDGWRLIVVASMSNLVFKWCIAAAAGHARLRWRVALLFTVPFVTGVALLWLWPI